MILDRPVRVALLGAGMIGRELINRTLRDPRYRYVAVGDTSGVIVNNEGFNEAEMAEVVRLKEAGGYVKNYAGEHGYCESMSGVFARCDVDVLIDVTDAQTHDLLMEALEYAHVMVSNKRSIADVPYSQFQRLASKAREERRVLDFGTTAGAGLRIPDLVSALEADEIERVEGCLSGTMNYVSQRINESAPLSTAVKEAMEPPNFSTSMSIATLNSESDLRSRICTTPLGRWIVPARSRGAGWGIEA
ncbi:hypothetical protein DRO42_04665 [Candidatus Bathyarchaeota archaeon]|nr:MAG: hypothetical protein DRO42_04665 [Candidatus Bathyarchaeota archaeon]